MMLLNSVFRVYLICIIICMSRMISAQTTTDILSLKKHLFDNSSYDNSVRPVLELSTLTEVRIRIKVFSFIFIFI